jgi:hypothetical protein
VENIHAAASTVSDVVTSAVTAVAGKLPLAALLGFLVRRAQVGTRHMS